MPKGGFKKAGFLLDEAAGHIAEAARIITTESAHAKHLTKDMSRMDPEWHRLSNYGPAPCLSMQELTELATKLSGHRNEVFMWGQWLQADPEEKS